MATTGRNRTRMSAKVVWVDDDAYRWLVRLRLTELEGQAAPVPVELHMTTDPSEPAQEPKAITSRLLHSIPVGRLARQAMEPELSRQGPGELGPSSDSKLADFLRWLNEDINVRPMYLHLREALNAPPGTRQRRPDVFWQNFYWVYKHAARRTDYPTVAIATAFDLEPNAASAWISRARARVDPSRAASTDPPMED